MSSAISEMESVDDYPRPPRIDPSTERARVRFSGVVVADSTRTVRILETQHAPTYYFPPSDVDRSLLSDAGHVTFCEWKGQASHLDVRVGSEVARQAAWTYVAPTSAFAAIAGWIAFYPARVDCFLGDEQARPMPGDYYGGWVTSGIVGAIKGGPGTTGW